MKFSSNINALRKNKNVLDISNAYSRYRWLLLNIAFFAGMQMSSGCALFGIYPISHLKLAETYRADGSYDFAIDEYRLHIAERLQDKKRSKDENPSFYYLLIGDCYLAKGDPENAKENYKLANQDNVSKEMTIDRYKQLARYYEGKADFNNGISLLREIRSLDPTLVDFEIDRIYKASLNAEDEKAIGTAPN